MPLRLAGRSVVRGATLGGDMCFVTGRRPCVPDSTEICGGRRAGDVRGQAARGARELDVAQHKLRDPPARPPLVCFDGIGWSRRGPGR